MKIRKVRGKNAIYPIKIYKAEYDLAKTLGLKIEDYINEYIKLIAEERKWTWYFEMKEKNEKKK
jgi:hypothetical protein